MSKRQHAREADGTRSSWETNGPDFQTFYQENVTLIYRFVLSKVGNCEEAEDLTSQVFLKAVRGMNPERGPYSRQKWLYQVARTTIADITVCQPVRWRNCWPRAGMIQLQKNQRWTASSGAIPPSG